jgi:hypothetical protein
MKEMMMEKPVYNVYEWNGNRKESPVVATITGEDIVTFGEDSEVFAKKLDQILREGGWPEVAPDKILFGDYLWAIKQLPPVVAGL